MRMMLYQLKQCRQGLKSRVVRRYMRVLIRCILIAVLVWSLLFFYTFVYKFEKSIRTGLNRLLFSQNDQNSKHLAAVERQNENNNEWGVYGNLKKNEFELAKIIDGKSLEFLKQIERRPYDVNCRSLIEWDEAEVRRAKRILYKLRNLNRLKNLPDNSQMLSAEPDQHIPLIDDENFIFPDSKCALFRDLRGYDKHKIDDLELNFPLAFSILTYNNVEQLERLLRAIYRPHNVYCIHVDSKSNKNVHAAIGSIAACFNNVFVATRLEHIVYAGYNRLKADINCMGDMVYPNYSHPHLAGKNFSTDWRYMLNLASSEFPLRTNYELVRVLNMFNGANDIEVIRNFQKERVLYSWKVKKKPNSSVEYLVRTKRLKSDVPHNYTIVKGITYCSFSRKFVEYVLTNTYAKNLLKWSEDTYSPDEWYWATINYNIQFNPPGGFRDETRGGIPSKARYIGWKNSYKCMGELRHNICVFAIEDLPELVTRTEFFLNKFLLEYDPIAYQCMEEWLNNRVMSHQTVNIINYCRLLFVIPYSINPSCARLIENKNYPINPLN